MRNSTSEYYYTDAIASIHPPYRLFYKLEILSKDKLAYAYTVTL